MYMLAGIIIFAILGLYRARQLGGDLGDQLQYVAVYALIGMVVGFFFGLLRLNLG